MQIDLATMVGASLQEKTSSSSPRSRRQSKVQRLAPQTSQSQTKAPSRVNPREWTSTSLRHTPLRNLEPAAHRHVQTSPMCRAPVRLLLPGRPPPRRLSRERPGRQQSANHLLGLLVQQETPPQCARRAKRQ